MKKNILLVSLFVFSYIYIIAQEKPQQNDLDKEYTPPSTSIFYNTSNNSSSRNFSEVTQSKNIVDISLASVIRGYSELTYERAITKKLSLTVGYGIYFMPDYNYAISGSLLDAISDGELGNSGLRDIINSSDFIAKKSHHYTFEIKFYFDKNDFETRNFLKFNTKIMNLHYKRNIDYNSTYDNSYIGIPETSLNSKMFILYYGCQWNMGNEKLKFSNELCIGGGFRSNKYYDYTKVELGSSYGYDNLNSSYYTKDSKETSEMKLTINFSYRLGIGW